MRLSVKAVGTDAAIGADTDVGKDSAVINSRLVSKPIFINLLLD